MPKTYTVPNQVTIQLVAMKGHRVDWVQIARRDGKQLAYYPCHWPGNFHVISMQQLQRDARWNSPKKGEPTC